MNVQNLAHLMYPPPAQKRQEEDSAQRLARCSQLHKTSILTAYGYGKGYLGCTKQNYPTLHYIPVRKSSQKGGTQMGWNYNGEELARTTAVRAGLFGFSRAFVQPGTLFQLGIFTPQWGIRFGTPASTYSIGAEIQSATTQDSPEDPLAPFQYLFGTM